MTSLQKSLQKKIWARALLEINEEKVFVEVFDKMVRKRMKDKLRVAIMRALNYEY